jgi:hypothetical protein
MREGSRVDSIIEKHRAFLALEEAERPLFGIRRHWDHRPPPFLFEDREEGTVIRPQDLDPEPFLDWYETFLEEDAQIPDDTFHPAKPYFAIPWMEAILGCPVRLYRSTMYPEPILDSWNAVERLNLTTDSPWFAKLMEFTSALVQRFAARFPLCATSLRGPGDIVASLRGRQRFCLDLYDHPADVRALADKCARLWVEVTNAQLEVIPSYAGGYFNRMHIWTPGTTTTPHIDFSALVSQQMFREVFLPSERLIAESFECPVYHTHSTSLHVVDDLLDMDNVAAIQVASDEGSRSLPELIRVLPAVQEKKPVIVIGRLTKSEMAKLADNLPAKGLCLMFWVDTVAEAQEFIGWAHTTWPRQ